MPIANEPDRRAQEFQAIALLSQAAPVINTWYDVLNIAGRGILYQVAAAILIANETLEWELTIDGVLFGVQGVACIIGTDYDGFISPLLAVPEFRTNLIAASPNHRKIDLHFRNTILIRLRKTTAVGAGNLIGMAQYSINW